MPTALSTLMRPCSGKSLQVKGPDAGSGWQGPPRQCLPCFYWLREIAFYHASASLERKHMVHVRGLGILL